MSTNLKRLMEQDAGRPVSPAPVENVLAGGRSRLRRRRVIGAVAAVVVALLSIAIPVGLTQDDTTDQPIGPGRSDSLTFTRADGTSFTIDGAEVRCPPPSETETDEQMIMVLAPSDRSAGGQGEFTSYFMVEAPIAEVADGATVTLPATVAHEGFGGPHLFVADARDENELSSSTEESSGTIAFESASCDPEPAIDMTMDATIGSEFFETPSVRVEDRLTLGG